MEMCTVTIRLDGIVLSINGRGLRRQITIDEMGDEGWEHKAVLSPADSGRYHATLLLGRSRNSEHSQMNPLNKHYLPKPLAEMAKEGVGSILSPNGVRL
jgi:hypothetical protein